MTDRAHRAAERIADDIRSRDEFTMLALQLRWDKKRRQEIFNAWAAIIREEYADVERLSSVVEQVRELCRRCLYSSGDAFELAEDVLEIVGDAKTKEG